MATCLGKLGQRFEIDVRLGPLGRVTRMTILPHERLDVLFVVSAQCVPVGFNGLSQRREGEQDQTAPHPGQAGRTPQITNSINQPSSRSSWAVHPCILVAGWSRPSGQIVARNSAEPGCCSLERGQGTGAYRYINKPADLGK